MGMQYGAGINATGGFGSANEARVGDSAILDRELLPFVSEVGVEHLTRDARDDAEIWRKIGEIGKAIWDAYQSQSDSGQALVGNVPIIYRGSADGVSMEIESVPDVVDMPRASRVELTQTDETVPEPAQLFDDLICLNPTCTSSIRR